VTVARNIVVADKFQEQTLLKH